MYEIVKEDFKNYLETEDDFSKPGIDDIHKMSPPQANIFLIYDDETFLTQKIMVPTQAESKFSNSSPKTTSSHARVPPPPQVEPLAKFRFLPKMLGRNDTVIIEILVGGKKKSVFGFF